MIMRQERYDDESPTIDVICFIHVRKIGFLISSKAMIKSFFHTTNLRKREIQFDQSSNIPALAASDNKVV